MDGTPQPAKNNSPHGLVISDLHLFARRSRGQACLDAVRSRLDHAEALVLNGDTFDFRWSILSSHEETEEAALQWLRRLAQAYPHCHIHYVMGNHDCLDSFSQRLTELAATLDNLSCHETSVLLGDSLFLHGDCANQEMDADRFARHRAFWKQDQQRGPLAAALYRGADIVGLTRLAHAWHFSPQHTVSRITYYLDATLPRWREQTESCYFGHTHLALTNFQHEGIVFHNTGSGIRGMHFNPLTFRIQG